MEDRLQEIKAFHLTGLRSGTALRPLDAQFRPVLLSRYSDTESLRYDFPVVLTRDSRPERTLHSLSALVDDAVGGLEGEVRDCTARHAYAIEEAVRRSLKGGKVDFSTAWTQAAEGVSAAKGPGVRESADLLWTLFGVEGELHDAGSEVSSSAFRSFWAAAAREKAGEMTDRITRLVVRLEGILAAEAAGSAAGRTPERLMAGMGSAYSASFDFEEMSRFLTAAKPEARIGRSRRERICGLIDELRGQRFYPVGENPNEIYDFYFAHPSKALLAYEERHESAVRFVRSLRIAELEASGDYRENKHGPLFENFGANGLDAGDLSELPEYLVCCVAEDLSAGDVADLVEMLSAGVPFNVVVRTDDVLAPSMVAEGHVSVGLRARQLVQTATGLTDVFVLQTPVSRLFADREHVLRGLRFDGPALFSIYSGSGGHSLLTPYLASAAALAARAFPAIVFDPDGVEERGYAVCLDGNPQAELDWETHEWTYEDAELQAHHEESSFTFSDLLSTDERFHGRFAVVPTEAWCEEMVPVAESLSARNAQLEMVPFITLADPEGVLQRAIVDYKVLNETRRCRAMWRKLREDHRSAPLPVKEAEDKDTAEPEKIADSAESSAPPASNSDVAPDDPYIETVRCTSCNECTEINSKMFAYDANKQAYIADADAGTFRQLVEAAESCQVSVIHPGKPRNPKEPGLDDLVKRAEEFN